LALGGLGAAEGGCGSGSLRMAPGGGNLPTAVAGWNRRAALSPRGWVTVFFGGLFLG
jgi:hypothetical protein